MNMQDLLVPEPKRLEIFSNVDIKLAVVDAMDELMRAPHAHRGEHR